MLQDPKWDEVKVKPELDNIGKHILRAAKYIETRGWCQDSFCDRQGRVCLEGALMYTRINDDTLGKSTLRVRHYLQGQRPAQWNDANGRTKDEVVKLMREAAYAKSE